jgi:hypothetical protein
MPGSIDHIFGWPDKFFDHDGLARGFFHAA